MTEKQFVYYEHKGADYILDTPNTELDFIEMLGDALETEEIVDKLNELAEKNKLHNERISLLSSLLDLADAIIDTSDNEKAKKVWENKNEQSEKKWERILND